MADIVGYLFLLFILGAIIYLLKLPDYDQIKHKKEV